MVKIGLDFKNSGGGIGGILNLLLPSSVPPRRTQIRLNLVDLFLTDTLNLK